jgi:hypothetical protein
MKLLTKDLGFKQRWICLKEFRPRAIEWFVRETGIERLHNGVEQGLMDPLLSNLLARLLVRLDEQRAHRFGQYR